MMKLTVHLFLSLVLWVTTSFSPNAYAGAKSGLVAAGTGAATLAIGALAANHWVAKGMKPPCHSPGGQAACAMMAMSIVMAAASGANAKQNYDTAKQAMCTTPSCYGFDTNGGSTGGGPEYPGMNVPELPGGTDGGVTRNPYSTTGGADTGGTANGGDGKLAGTDSTGGSDGGDNDFKIDPKKFEKLGIELETGIAEVNQEMAALAKMGYKYDPEKGVLETPRGPINPASLGSPAAMSAAGFSPQQISLAEAAKEGAIKEAKKKVAAFNAEFGDMGGAGEDEGGGGVRVAAAGGTDMNAWMKKMMAQQGGAAGARGPASVAGLSKTYGGEKIGVQKDNIFEMMDRRYKNLRSRGQFLAD